MTLDQAQHQVDEWIKTHGVRYFSELTNMTILTEEVGEVARIMAQDDPSRIFQQEMLGDLDHQRARQNLLFITERHKDIITLEKSIRELHQLFVDMAALVRPLCDGFPSFFFVVDQRNL